jgi:hypothetical protein
MIIASSTTIVLMIYDYYLQISICFAYCTIIFLFFRIFRPFSNDFIVRINFETKIYIYLAEFQGFLHQKCSTVNRTTQHLSWP